MAMTATRADLDPSSQRRELAKPFEHDATLAQLRERRAALVSELQVRNDDDVIVQEPEAEPNRLRARGRAADCDAAIAR